MTDSPTSSSIATPGSAPFAFDNTYARQMEGFWMAARPAPARAPRLVAFNRELAQELGLDADALDGEHGARIFSGVELPEGAEPIAQAYAGHQFGGFSPQLGDGRALLLGEVVDVHGRRRDIQLKGSGPTHFSRGGDGLSALGPVLREYLVSEAMHRLGAPTTRALAAVVTGEQVYREEPVPGGVFTRVASSHLRVGTFQYFAARNEIEKVRQLADYTIQRHDPDLDGADDRYFRLLERVRDRQAELVAHWMRLGFIHGVMNTDNTSISGETIDYGPCAFMERYDEGTVFSSIDRNGRYAYGRQPRLALWNLARFAETLLPFIDDDKDKAVARAIEAVEEFGPRYEERWLAHMRAKIGLATEREGDAELVGALLSAMYAGEIDFTNAFRALCEAAGGQREPVRTLFEGEPAIDAWLEQWNERLAHEAADPAACAAAMARVNPAYIPRNHVVEAALEAAVERDDYGPFGELHAVLSRPFEEQEGREAYAQPAPKDAEPYQTFCGT